MSARLGSRVGPWGLVRPNFVIHPRLPSWLTTQVTLYCTPVVFE